MITLADRLRGVVRPAPVVRPASVGQPAPVVRPASAVPPLSPRGAAPAHHPEAHAVARGGDGLRERAGDVTDVLGGAWDDPVGRRFATIDRVYRPGHRHGSIAMADGLPPAGGWSRLHLLAGAPCGERLLFVDLETTGLAGGAGTQAFLVGCGWFDGGTFRVRQFLLTSPRGERAMLEAVATVADAADTVVTYNGKSFDLPLIETRFLFQRMETPFAGKPHVDMLHTARRLWRADSRREPADEFGAAASSGCRLSELERALCGHERDGDVPGFEIPSRYFHYVRTGDATSLSAVIEHNRLDLLSLALLTARAAQLLDLGPSSARSVREAFGLGRLYERGGLLAEARASYTRAWGVDPGASDVAPAEAARWLVGGADDDWTRAEALRALAVLARRGRRFDEAAERWRAALALPRCPAHIAREAAEALAVHHEHRLRDLRVAHGFALRSLQGLESRARLQAVQRRVARLCRKLEETQALSLEP